MSKKKNKVLMTSDFHSSSVITEGKPITQEDIEAAAQKLAEHLNDATEYLMAGDLLFKPKDDQEKMAQAREWCTKKGEIIKYEDMTDDHIFRVLKLFEQGKFKHRLCHLKGLKQEQLRRKSEAGDILYGK